MTRRRQRTRVTIPAGAARARAVRCCGLCVYAERCLQHNGGLSMPHHSKKWLEWCGSKAGAGSHGGARDSARSEGESSQPVPVKGVGTLRPQPRRPRSQAEGPSRDDRVPLDITTRAFDGLEPAKAGRKPTTMEPRRKRAYRVRVERPRRARKGGAPRPRVMSPAWSGGPRRCDVHTRKHANNCQDTRAGRRGATRTKTPP